MVLQWNNMYQLARCIYGIMVLTLLSPSFLIFAVQVSFPQLVLQGHPLYLRSTQKTGVESGKSTNQRSSQNRLDIQRYLLVENHECKERIQVIYNQGEEPRP